MAATINDKFSKISSGARPTTTVVESVRSVSGTTLSCADLTGWDTDAVVHFVTYKKDGQGNVIAGSQIDAKGIVSGNTITSFTVTGGTDIGNAVGDIVQVTPTARWAKDLADGLLVGHNQDGSHKAEVVTTLKTAILGVVYPVGSIYINATSATNPATLLGFGTWVAFGAGRVPVGFDATQTEFNTNEKTGGAKTHTLTASEMPAHTHTIGSNVWSQDAGYGQVTIGSTSGANRANIVSGVSSSAGSGAAHNNLQPYITVRMWKRTA